MDDAKVFREEIAFFQAVKAVIVKFTAKPPVSEERKDSLLKQILDNAVVAEGVDDIFALAGIEKPDLSILSDEFLAEVKRMPYKNLALELLHKLLNDEFNSRLKTNVVLGKKYSELLKNSINRLIAKGVESAHVIEELIEIAEQAASSGVYSLLKREDEKHVTEQAYEHPVFVEDLVRGVAVRLRDDERLTWYRVESENFESIHNHSAYASVEQSISQGDEKREDKG